MFGIDFNELLLIAVVALVVLGPERLPGAARTAGALARRARQAWANVQNEVERELEAESLKHEIGGAVAGLRAVAEPLAAQARAAAAELASGGQQAIGELRAAAASAAAGSAGEPGATAAGGMPVGTAAAACDPATDAATVVDSRAGAQAALAAALRELADALALQPLPGTSAGDELRAAAAGLRAAAQHLTASNPAARSEAAHDRDAAA